MIDGVPNARHPLFNRWARIRKTYGTEALCERWQAFATFVLDLREVPDGTDMCLTRWDHTRPYGPENYLWAERTYVAQVNNPSHRVCGRGHLLAGPNLVIQPGNGTHRCRKCSNAATAAGRASRRVEINARAREVYATPAAKAAKSAYGRANRDRINARRAARKASAGRVAGDGGGP